MAQDADQEKRDQAEWENPDNWTLIYFSKRDSRPWVPKRTPAYGWTINFGHPKGARWIYYLMLIFLLLGGLLGICMAGTWFGAG